jgi:hypothetical protein
VSERRPNSSFAIKCFELQQVISKEWKVHDLYLKWMHFGLPLLLLGMSAAFPHLSTINNRVELNIYWHFLSGRTLTLLTFVESALVYGGILSAYRVIFRPGLVFKFLPEIWRLVTPFLLTGPRLSFLFDLYFSMIAWRLIARIDADARTVFTYSSQLETGSPRFSDPADFLTYLIFVSSVIVVSCSSRLASPPFPFLFLSTSHICPPSL